MALPIVSKNRIRLHPASRPSNIVVEPPLTSQFAIGSTCLRETLF
jgi:hypothetical protein